MWPVAAKILERVVRFTGPLFGHTHRLNMALDLPSLFGLHVYRILWFYCRYLDRSWQHRQGPVPPAPSRPRRFGLFKVALTISLGLAIGAFIREEAQSRPISRVFAQMRTVHCLLVDQPLGLRAVNKYIYNKRWRCSSLAFNPYLFFIHQRALPP